MGVPLRLLLGVFLALCLDKTQAKTLHKRDTIFPLQLSNQNGTEKINNRDINKIKVDPPKTELSDDIHINSKIKATENNLNVINKDANINSTLTNNKLKTQEDKINASNKVTNHEIENNLPINLEKNVQEKTDTNNENSKEKKEEKSNKKKDVEKEIDRLETGRSIDSDTSKFWSSDFHNKNNVFTLSSSVDNQKFFHEDEDESPLEANFPSTTFSVTFEVHSELTTPKSQFFDKKFKEAVDSIEQTLDTDDVEEEIEPIGDVDELSEFNPDGLVQDKRNGTLEYVKTKTIINNKTTDKNSLHKDVDVEETKNISFEKVYNDTTSYDSTLEQPKTVTSTQKADIETSNTTSNVFSKIDIEKEKNLVLSNKIESESSVTPLVSASTTMRAKIHKHIKDTAYKKNLLEPIEHNIIPLQLSDIEKDQKSSFSDSKIAIAEFSDTPSRSTTIKMFDNINGKNNLSTITTERLKKINIQSNIIENTTSESLATPNKNSYLTESIEKETESTVNVNIPSKMSTTDKEIVNTSELPTTSTLKQDLTTSELPTTSILKQDLFTSELPTTSTLKQDLTTTEVAQSTTGISDTTRNKFFEENTTYKNVEVTSTESAMINDETTTTFPTEKNSRNFKFLETTEKENWNGSTLISDIGTTMKVEASTTDKTTEITTILNLVEKEITENVKPAFENIGTTVIDVLKKEMDMTTNKDMTTPRLPTTDIVKTQETTMIPTTTELYTTTDSPPPPVTGKIFLEYATTTKEPIQNEETTTFKENTTENQTEAETTNKSQQIVTPDQTSTTEFTFVHIKKQDENHTTIIPDQLGPNLDYSTAKPSQEQPISYENTTKTVDNAAKIKVNNRVETNISTENSTTTQQTEQTPSEELTNDGGANKGTIAAIAISCVGAVCLVLLGVLLYVMRKRQKRFKYGPRCTPVSLDEYSIDNLSVYNSVRRKGNDRTSKRSFGNPAFEDPSGVSHPLNFLALSKFSTNIEDINAEFEDIPQIYARTSELPEGCDSKNRYANVIPLPETRVFLKSLDGVPNSDYINANYVTGPKNIRNYYIATQGPMQNTVDDFWRMIWEQQAKVVLMMTHLIENGLEKCVDYLPESEVINNHRMFGDFQVTLKKREVKDKYIISTLQLKNMVSNSWREVTHFWYLGWPERGVPNEANSLIAFLIEARSSMKTATIDKRNESDLSNIQNGGPLNDHNPVVVHCSPGTGRTGVVIACDIAIREFETTRLVDIPKVVCKIRRDRANSVQSKEQYQFIYKVISLYATKLTGGQFLKE